MATLVKSHFLILMFACFLYAHNISFGQFTQGKSDEVRSLVISLSKADFQTVIPQVINRFKKVPRVIIDGYCEKQNLVFFKTDNQTFFDVLICLKELDLVYYIRKDVTDALLKSCNDLSSIKTENYK
jgi:hypothetical protein